MTARLFHKLKLEDKAEELYIGSLIINPEVSVIKLFVFHNYNEDFFLNSVMFHYVDMHFF